MLKKTYEKVRDQLAEAEPRRDIMRRSEKPAMIAGISLGSAALLAAGTYLGLRLLREAEERREDEAIAPSV